MNVPSPPVIAKYHLPSVLLRCLSTAHCYSIHSAVFYLVPSSISDSNTRFSHTCLFGYCVWLKCAILHVMQNIIYKYFLFPPHMILVNRSAGFSSPSTIDVCRKGFTHCYRLMYYVITYNVILLFKYKFGLQGIINYRHTISVDVGSTINGNAHHT